MQQELLIVGIDPGITTAYAVLDLEGKLLKVRSAKNLYLSNLLKEITAEGKVLIVGTDVKHNPSLIEKFATKVGAKIITPKEDMKIWFKRRITSAYKTYDDHQRDALAAALQAYKQTQPLLSKVDSRLNKVGKEHLAAEVKRLVVQGQQISQAIESFEKKATLPLKKKRKKTKLRRVSTLAEENAYLKKQNRLLLKKVQYVQNKMQQQQKKVATIIQRKIKDILLFKNRKIKYLNKELGRYRKDTTYLQNEVDELNLLLLATKGKVLAKKIQTLHFEEVKDNLEGCDVLLVDEVNKYSEKSLAYLRDKVRVILYKTPPDKKLLSSSFIFVNAARITTLEKGSLALVDKEQLEEERKKKDIFTAIVQEYQEERQSLL